MGMEWEMHVADGEMDGFQDGMLLSVLVEILQELKLHANPTFVLTNKLPLFPKK